MKIKEKEKILKKYGFVITSNNNSYSISDSNDEDGYHLTLPDKEDVINEAYEFNNDSFTE